MRFSILMPLFCCLSLALSAQNSSKWFVPRNIQQAYKNETRSIDGTPGKNYWQNRADYQIQVDFDPDTRLVKGKEKITYYNNSPDRLVELYFHLYPDLYKKGIRRDVEIEYEDETDGVQITRMIIDGNSYTDGKGGDIENEHTLATVFLDKAIASGAVSDIEIHWEFELNKGSHERGGQVDDGSFFLAYFFPRLAVYDDIDGWNEDGLYTGAVEFYHDFGDFDVEITVPTGYIVHATGLLQNAGEVLQEPYLGRYKSAFSSNEVISIIGKKEAGKKGVTADDEKLTWHYRAEDVTDFAFGTSNHFLWEAKSLVVDQETGRRTMIDVAYNKDAKDFYSVIDFSEYSVNFFSTKFPGYPFPFPQQTIFNGESQMEYPMMANDNSLEDIQESFALTGHEIMHAYFPFLMGFNEQKYAWMDEGLTIYAEWLLTNDHYGDKNEVWYNWEGALENMGTDDDAPLMMSTIHLDPDISYENAYYKPAMLFHLLADYLGEDNFRHALHQFMDDWQGKHPTGYDFLYSINTHTYEDIKWLVGPWFFEFGYPDLAVLDLIPQDYGYDIIIGRIGSYPTNLELKVIHTDGSTGTIHHDAGIWKDGDQKLAIVLKTDKKIKELTITDDDLIIDVNPDNNRFLVKE